MDNEKKIRRIGILTSGGDAPGMNAAIRAAVRTCVQYDVKPVGIYRGYNGLINGDIQELNARSVNGLTNKGGTMLYTARCPEFATPEGLRRAAETCRYKGIDALIAIGGDGTFRGLRDLSGTGVKTIGIPCTIDNDIGCSDYTIGFDTASNTAVDCIDKLSDTMQSHERCSVVEVMGRGAGHLALYVGISVGATAIIIPEKPFDFENDVAERILQGQYNGKHHFLIIVAEGTGKTNEVAEMIRERTGIDTRVSIIGHVQRGGSPSVRDRVTATQMGHYAVTQLLKGTDSSVVALRNSKITHLPINEALEMKKGLDMHMYTVAEDVCV